MNSDIDWLALVVGIIVIARMDFVATGPVCSDDYWPCTCEVVKTSSGNHQLRINCDQIIDVQIVKAVFERTPPADVHSFHMTIPETSGLMPKYLFQKSIIRNIYLTCQTDRTTFSFDMYSFTSLRNFLESFHIDNCDLSQTNWGYFYDYDFLFLKSLTFSRIKCSNNFGKFFSSSDSKFPHLSNIVMSYCQNLTAILNTSSFWSRTKGFEIVVMNGNELRDVDAEFFLERFSYGSKKTLRSFSLTENRLTQLPNIGKFTELTHLRLDNNNFTSENFSLAQLNGNRLRTLTLSSCGLKNIQPHAFEVDSDSFQLKLLDLDKNGLTRFESSVFQSILQKMANRWEDPGIIHVSRNSFDCDCHLAWLIVDNRHLLRHVRGARCSDGRAFKKLSPSQFAACNGTSGQLKPRLPA